MKSLPPSKRGCRFPEESETLSFHKNYSRTSCVFECGLKRAKDELQCIPWYLPQLAGVMPCRFWSNISLQTRATLILCQLDQNRQVQRSNGSSWRRLLWLSARLWRHGLSICPYLELVKVRASEILRHTLDHKALLYKFEITLGLVTHATSTWNLSAP